jgi:hypothetical protein
MPLHTPYLTFDKSGRLAGGAGATRFNPADFGTVVLRARVQDQSFSNGDPVGTLVSSIGPNFTASGGQRPTFTANAFGTKPSARFAGGQTLATGAITISQPCTIAIFYRMAAVTSFAAICDGVDVSNRILGYISSNALNIYAGNFVNGTRLTQASGHCMLLYCNGASSKALVDGVQDIATNFGSNHLAGLTIGSAYDASSGMTGDIAEVIVWSGDIGSDGQVATKAYGVSEYAINGGFTTTDTTIGGINSRFIVPDVRRAGTAVVHCHGLGEGAADVSGTDIAKAKILDVLDLLAGGYLVAASDLGGNTYDNATAVAAYDAQVAALVSTYGVTKIMNWGQSAGGPLALYKVAVGATGVTIYGAALKYAITDLDWAHSSGTLASSVNSAFPSYPTDASGKDPILISSASFAGKAFQFIHSPDDTVVDYAANATAFHDHVSGAAERTIIDTTGDHGDSSNFTEALAQGLVSFVGRYM